jgi:hypothetical protein
LRPKLPADDPRGYGPRLGPAVEEKQRELELREKAVKIGGDQRRRLLALRDAVLAALAGVGRVADGEGTRALAARLGGEADGSLTLAIFEALAAARARHAVPVLIRRLESSKDPAVRGAARKTLTAIAGADLGEGREAWERWWEENKGG